MSRNILETQLNGGSEKLKQSLVWQRLTHVDRGTVVRVYLKEPLYIHVDSTGLVTELSKQSKHNYERTTNEVVGHLMDVILTSPSRPEDNVTIQPYEMGGNKVYDARLGICIPLSEVIGYDSYYKVHIEK